MKDISSNESLSIPEGVDIKIKSRIVTVTGPRGTLTKAVRHIQMDIQIVSGSREDPGGATSWIGSRLRQAKWTILDGRVLDYGEKKGRKERS
jgi:large subunit ribosomal protein L9e